MSFRCAHFADIHFRGLTRHEEYREVFTESFQKLRSLKPDVIFLGGDIVHSKTQGISPELIEILRWWFTSLSEIAPVHVILGNHDGLMLNEDRLDAITPIVKTLNNPRIQLMKGSGVYPTGIPGFNWCVFCCFDPRGWDSVKPVPGDINIAAFHGAVNGSLTDQDWEINGDSIKVDFFKNFEFGFLGDIHKRQFLTPTVAYPGSPIQQNYGEDIEKGFLFWEIEDAEDFKVEFVELSNSRAFRTISWTGDVSSTIETIPSSYSGSRFRVAHSGMTQMDFRQLQTSLKEKFKACEVVSKNESSNFVGGEQEISTSIGKISRNDLRSFTQQDKLMSDYVSSLELSEDNRSSLRDLHKDIFKKCVQQVTNKSHQWRLKKISFDNTFGYGENNIIDFDTLSGITGIFGKNRSGKSSIPGTLVYSLFNSTDRGTMKNIHVMNSRKNFCRATTEFSVAGELYRADRQTIKKVSRSGNVSAPTNLNLLRIDSSGEVLKDDTGEQRRETEKVLRELVGTVDDFMMTSFASQGEMNAFIREGSTKRKAILTRFLDLQIFDDMLKVAKNEMTELRGEMKTAPDRNWDDLIEEQTDMLDGFNSEKQEIEDELLEKKERRDDLKIQLAALPTSEKYTVSQIEDQASKLSGLENKKLSLRSEIVQLSNNMDSLTRKLTKIEMIKDQFPIVELKSQLEAHRDLKSQYELLDSRLQLELQRLESKKKLSKKLKPCSCAKVHRPTCKYLKDSNKSEAEVNDQKQVVSAVRKEIRALKANLGSIVIQALNEKIEKYETILEQEQESKLSYSEMKLELRELESTHQEVKTSLSAGKDLLREMRLRSIDEEKDAETIKMRNDLKQVEKRISELDAERLYLAEQISIARQRVGDLKEESKRFGAIKQRWETYSTFISAVDKKGIPLTILSLQLPQINSELRKILQGVVNFDVILATEKDSNHMDIYIDYGDSRRIIECGSGMEKMISSLALRVALINICNAPRSDVLIIDEGFGALDDKNIEACSRLLISLKKYFSNILIISHVDAVKDVVDNVLDIRKNGKDAHVRSA